MGLTPDIWGLIILGICVVLFVTNWLPAAATGVLGCLLMVLVGAAGYQEAFSGFSSSIVMLMASAMIIGIAMFKTGVARIVGRAAVRLSKGKEQRLLLAISLMGGVLSMFFANTAIIAVFIPIIESAAQESDGKLNRYHLVLPMALSVMIGGAATLVGCTPQLTANGMMKSLAGLEMGMWTLTGPTVCIFGLYLVYMLLFGYTTGNRVFESRQEKAIDVSRERMQEIKSKTVDKRKMTWMCIILALMLAGYVTNVIPVAYTAMICALLTVVTGLVSVKEIVRELNWETVVFLAACLGLAEAVTVSGAGDTIGRAVSAVMPQNAPPFLFFGVMVVLTLVLSQFITNSTAIVIGLPISLSLCVSFSMNPMPFCVGVTLAASLACCTPLASAQIAMTQVAGYSFTDYVRYCLLPQLVMLAGILLFVPLFFPLVG